MPVGSPIVIDTNVGVVANGGAGVSLDCELACVDLLVAVTAGGHLVVDTGDRIFDEYRRQLSLAGQPGVGDMFIKWVHDHRHNETHCSMVELTEIQGDPQDFDEFPRDPALSSFDPADRKFVAVASAHRSRPPIHAATDRGWLIHRTALAGNGVKLVWLGP